ncbi:hypothetical protein pipiens_004565 [Culex pipiens pipiens]|uniref:Odorant receptor n=1 Tax=Culex pipiens pipiens TaxID=38569 RepID=A0ABD1CIF0_CULPP
MVAFARKLWNRFNYFLRALTRDFNYVTDQFFGLDWLVVLAGVRFGSEHVKLRRCWNVYRWLIYLPLIVVFWNLVVNLVNRAKLDLVLSCLLGVVGGIVAALRALLVLWYYEPLQEVRRYYLQEELGNCVELHVEFLHIKNKIRPMLNATFVIVFYSTALTLASGAIYLSQLKFMTIFSLVILCYCVGVALECFCITRMVNTMSESNASIAQKIYNLEWPKNLEYDETYNAEYHSVRKTMTTVMVMAQQPLRLNCFGLFEFTQDKFYELLNMAYSLYTFLKNFV